VILCYRKEPGKEINDNRGQFPQILDFLFSPFCQLSFLRRETRPILTHLATRRNAGNRKRLERLQLLLSRVKRFEHSEAVERLERLERAAALRGAERLNPSIGLRAGYLERLERDPFW
jgi:hypothetical protein